MKKIGFIGMGIMGLPMALNLVKKSGREIMGFDVVEEKRAIFVEHGGISVDNTMDIIKSCNVIFLCLPTNDLVKSTIKDIISFARSGTVIVDLSSTALNVVREMYYEAMKAGISLIDSPVSGGEAGAIEGTLAIMCGGDKEIFDEVESLLHCVGANVTYLGKTGCGAVAKLANNMIVGCNLASVGEAFAFAVKAGLDPEALFSAIKDGFAGSAVLSSKAPKLISGNYEASARVAVHQKDLKNAVQLAGEMGIEIPMSKMVLDYMNELEGDGRINEDHCAVAKIYEKRMSVKISKN
ncbi:MAG: prephenate dehydrogenase/arogenate dehydrogenase family protein [Sedimentibacter sp.]|uniref:NAD(P)-dependent oxidoreductase n=1 Tax=Sedimentibacter sp. TaxID=1960295 RepID=UPI0031591783